MICRIGSMNSRWQAPLAAAGTLGLLIAAHGCGDSAAGSETQKETTVTTSSQQSESLEGRLESRKAEFSISASDEIKAIYGAGVQAVRDSGIESSAKNTGDEAPAFTLQNASGSEVSLASLLSEGPVVLTWYRGGWCPYCNITLRALQEQLPAFTERGATLVALTPEVPDKSLSTKEKNELTFEVLTDLNNEVAKRYGVVFELTNEVHEIYNDKFSFDSFNGNEDGELPLAATYVIGTDGVIRYAFLDSDYTRRAEPAEILAALDGLK